MGRYEDIAWMEDIDLSGGPAAIAANLNQFSGYPLNGTDAILAVRDPGLFIKRIMTADETPLTAAAFGDLALATRRGGDISLPLSTPDGPGVLELPGQGIPLPPAEQMDVLGNASGAGAEQHAVVVRIWNPNHSSDFVHRNPPANAEVCIYEMPTDANTASTIDNFVDVCGRSNAYTNGQTALPDDAQVQIYVHAIRAIVPAGQTGIALAMPGQNHAYIYPAPALSNVRFDFVKEFGAPFYCTGARPLQVASFGTATTLIPLVLEMSVVRPSV